MKNIYDVLRQKENDLARLQHEVDALRISASLLADSKAQPEKGQALTQPQMVADILRRNGEPMHLSKVAEAIKRRFKQKLKTTHLAPMVYRNIKNGTLFYKVEGKPNTFGLLEWQGQLRAANLMESQNARVA